VITLAFLIATAFALWKTATVSLGVASWYAVSLVASYSYGRDARKGE
jgi:hypothetical protein